MKHLSLTLILWIAHSAAVLAQAPCLNFEWAVKGGGNSINDFVSGNAIAIDAQGNSYVTGTLQGMATFGSFTLNNVGGFIAKLDANGNFLWVKFAEVLPQSIAVDGSGNNYVTGSFSGAASFGSTTLTNAGFGDRDIFITKLDSDGNFLWAKKAGGNNFDQARDIVVDASGNSYVTGEFQSTATFGSTTLTGNSGVPNIFIIKLDASGNFLWAKKAGGNSSGQGIGIAIDASGNSYVTGWFEGLFGPTFSLTSSEADIFIAKYDGYGDFLWAIKGGGTGWDNGNGIAVDALGNGYVTGSFQGSATFGSTTLTNSGLNDIFIAKVDASGNFLWAKKAGGSNSDNGIDIAIDTSGNSYITGWFDGTATFGNTTLTGSIDVFISKLDDNGNFLWTLKAGGTGQDNGNGIAVDASGNRYVTGDFRSSAFFGDTPLTSSAKDVFITKIKESVLNVSPMTNINIQCGQSVTLPGQAVDYIDLKWSPSTGLNNTNILSPLATPLQTTTYTLTVTDICGNTENKSVTVIVPPAFTLNATATNNVITCGASTTLNSAVAENIPNISYSWIPSTGLSNPNVANPTANPSQNTTYMVTATTSNGCFQTASVTVNVTPAFSANASTADDTISCGTSTTLNATVTENIPNLTYLWSPATGLSNTNTANPTATIGQNSTYTVTVGAPNGCSETATVTINVTPYTLNTTATDETVTCGTATTLNATVTENIPELSYLWTPATGLSNPNVANPTASPNANTTYTVTATTPDGCFSEDSVTVDVIPFTLNATPTNTTIACGTSTTLNAAVTENISNLSYAWSPATGLSHTDTANPTASPTENTTYTVTATTPNGCSETATVTVNVTPFTLNATATNNTITCGTSTTLNATVTESIPNLSYSWSPVTGLSNTNTANPTARPNENTTYTVTATTPDGCSNTATVTINVNPYTVNATATATTINCGTSTQLNASVSGGVQNISYAWSPATGLSNTNTANPTASPNENTTYTVTATTPDGCSATESITINIDNPNPPVLNITSNTGDFKLCNNGLTLSASGYTDYHWSNGSIASSINVTHPGTYSLTAVDNGCTGTGSVTITPLAEISTPQGTVLCPNQANQSLQLNATGGMDSYLWSNGAQTQSIQVTQADNYSVTVMQGSCTYTTSVQVTMSNGQAQADFSHTSQNLTVNFNVISPSINFLSWDFGDGGTSFDHNPIHTYASPGTYDVTIAVTDVCGNTADRKRSITVPTQVSIDESEVATTIRLYPNPTGGQFTVSAENETLKSLTLTDLNGRILMHKMATDNEKHTDASFLPSGLYLLHIHTQNGTTVKRLVKK